MNIKATVINNTVELPKLATTGSAGIDFKANNFICKYNANNYLLDESYIIGKKAIPLSKGERLLVGTGIKMAIPEGYELDIRPRSGKALKEGITVLNSPGTIDSDYRGEIGIILTNVSNMTIFINLGDKIAQGVLLKVNTIELILTDELEETKRNEGGFGSTDSKN